MPSNGLVLAHPWECSHDCTAAETCRLQPGTSPPQKIFTQLCSSGGSGITVNHNTLLVPGFTINVLVPTTVNMAVLQGPLGLYLWVATQPLPNVLPAGEPPLPVWLEDHLDLAVCSRGFALPTRALPGIKLWSFRLCTPLFIAS